MKTDLQSKIGERKSFFIQIRGVTLHSYRYVWAERAKTAGCPERFAQEALGHNSKAVHRAFAKRALMKLPSLEDYEQRAAAVTAPAS
jgi:integrase